MTTSLHSVVGRIRSLLEEKNIAYRFFEHAAVRTSEEAMKQRPEYTLQQGAKALIVCGETATKEKKFFMAVIPANKRLDGRKAAAAAEVKKVRFATKEESDKITGGIEFGGVPPFGNLFELAVYVDPTLFENAEIIFNCGDRRASIAMSSEDYRSIIPSTIADTVEDK